MTSEKAQEANADLADETDADLLICMSLSADDPSGARAAWAEFYARHVEYLYAVTLRAYGALLGGPPGAADLVAETFKRAYANADKFDAGGVTDRDQLRLRTRAWLGRIAQRLAQTALRERGRVGVKLLAPEQWTEISRPPETPPGDPGRIERVRAAIESLNEREQLVIRTTFQWYRPEKDHQRLPNDVAGDLAETLATTPENLRQIRRRALRKIREFLTAREEGGQAGAKQ